MKNLMTKTILGGLVCAAAVTANATNWWSGDNGEWSSSGCWNNGSAVDTSADYEFNKWADTTITFESAYSISGSVVIHEGSADNDYTVTFSASDTTKGLTIGSKLKIGATAGGVPDNGALTVSGGVFTVSQNVELGQWVENSTATPTCSLTLSGGILATKSIYRGLGTATANLTLDGGTLKALQNGTIVFSGVNFSVGENGGTIDTANFDVTNETSVTGTGALTVTGGGTLTLNNISGYTGIVSVESGSLVVPKGYSFTLADATMVANENYGENQVLITPEVTTTWNAATSGIWSESSNWSNDVPDSSKIAVFPAGEYSVYLSTNETYDCCRGIKVAENGNVTLCKGENDSGWCRVDLYGDITGSGTLTLNNAQINNSKSSDLTISCPIVSKGNDFVGGYAVRITNSVTVEGELRVWQGNSEITGAMTFNDGSSMKVSSSSGDSERPVALNNATVAANATITLIGKKFTGKMAVGTGATVVLDSSITTDAGGIVFTVEPEGRVRVPDGATVATTGGIVPKKATQVIKQKSVMISDVNYTDYIAKVRGLVIVFQ